MVNDNEFMKIANQVATRCNLPADSVANVIRLLDDGATIPFMARYRKEMTGALDEVRLREVESALKYVRDLEKRREYILENIASQNLLNETLKSKIMAAGEMTDLEDLYAPYKPKKRTRATMARERGLEPLAKKIMSGFLPDATDDDISGASDIIAEWASESPRLRNTMRNTLRRGSRLVSMVSKGKEADLEASTMSQYGNFSQSTRRIASHQYLALRRAEREGLVKVRYEIDDPERLYDTLCRQFRPDKVHGDCRTVIEDAVGDAAKRLLRPSVENEISGELKQEADRVAIDIFASNLRQLLLAAPLKGKRVLALDPGYRTGCKVVALDAQGNLLEDTVIYPVEPRRDTEGATRILDRMVKRHGLQVAALGNGTASRETERFLKHSGVIDPEHIFVVNEDGASVYSASDLARKEFPDKDVTVRGAVSIGRRLIDPLAELVKIDPKSIGVGQYQHDVDQKALKDALDFTVTSCVNAVGVDVNTASERLLSYISGIGPALASNIVAYRAANGNFKSRRELKKVPKLGAKAFELCAGFLRIPDGDNPLDNTGIHPESYDAVKALARSLGADISQLPGNPSLLDSADIDTLAGQGVAGRETLADIIRELRKPGRDPRTDDNSDSFHPSIDSFEQLTPGQTVAGVVNNITAFGAFVNLGIKENGLIHISQLSDRRVSSVTEVLNIGQQIEARVLSVDAAKRRISLSLIR